MFRTSSFFVAVCLSVPCAAVALDRQPESPPPLVVQESQPIDGPHARVRWGVDGAIGVFVPATAVDFGAAGRVGIQLNDNLAFFGEFGFAAGLGLAASSTNSSSAASISGVAFYHLAPMAELSLGKFFVAGGPMLLGGGWAQISATSDSSGNSSEYAISAGGIMPGLDLRAGFTFGEPDPETGRRRGFTLAADLKLMYATVSRVELQSGSGSSSASANVGDHLLGASITLMLGFDSK